MLIELDCAYCGKIYEREKGEVNRQRKRGRINFFCSLSCGAKYSNGRRDDLRVEILKKCLNCKKEFKTMTGCKSPSYCSRSCASKGSVSDYRLEAQSKAGKKHTDNLIKTAETLKRREFWKYDRLKYFLDYEKEKYEFEFSLGSYIYDLALIKRKIFVEFDGKEHSYLKKYCYDKKKDSYALSLGWVVKRVEVEKNTVLNPEILYKILDY